MQDPTSSPFQPVKLPYPEQEQLKCPRCDSTNTKFCYYNNYNLSQPRHFCKNCRRYWTKGGALRNIPVGGGSRKSNKRSSNTKRSSTSLPADKNSGSGHDPTRVSNPDNQKLHGSVGSNVLERMDPVGSDVKMLRFGGESSSLGSGSGLDKRSGLELHGGSSSIGGGGYVGMQSGNSSYWNGGSTNVWPDLSTYNPRSSVQ